MEIQIFSPFTCSNLDMRLVPESELDAVQLDVELSRLGRVIANFKFKRIPLST